MDLAYDPSIIRAREIHPPRILFTASDFSQLKSHALDNLGFPIEFYERIDLKLDKMAICKKGSFLGKMIEACGHDERGKSFPSTVFIFRMESILLFFVGLVGKAILQIPVEGGHKGGRFTARSDKNAVVFNTSEDSRSNFYLTTFYNGCRYSMEPITEGVKVSLIFNVVWKDEMTESPKDIPSFISSYCAVKEALTKWIPRQTSLNSIGVVHGEQLGN